MTQELKQDERLEAENYKIQFGNDLQCIIKSKSLKAMLNRPTFCK